MSHTASSADRYRSCRRHRLATLLVCTDSLLVVLAGLLATFLRFGSTGAAAFGHADLQVQYLQLSLCGGLIWPLFLHAEQLYAADRLFRGSGELTRVLRALTAGTLALLVVTYVVGLPGLSRIWALLSWALAVAFVSAGRGIIRLALMHGYARGRWCAPTLIVGANTEALRTIDTLRADPSSGMVPYGVLTSHEQDPNLHAHLSEAGIDILGPARDLRRIVQQQPVTSVIIAASAFSQEAVARMIIELRDMPVQINLSAGLFEVMTRRVLVREIAGVPLIAVQGVYFSRASLLKKRLFDIVIASVVLLAGMPLWLAIMALIKLDGGPVFYRQPRVGRRGAPFRMYKFRSMVVDAEARLAQLAAENEADGPLFKVRHDPRVTRVGRVLRKYSLDEFPQLLNVFRGEMSLVGPRPPLPRETEQYGEQEWKRLEVLPGLTGLWQVSGRSNLSFNEMIRLDLCYIENWSVRLDMSVLLRTVPAVVFARGAY